MELFVPGRICILGEHTDWAGGHRRVNAEIGKGYAIISGTNQGIYATAEASLNKLVFETTLDSNEKSIVEIPMQLEALFDIAQRGDFYSYVAGVAYQIMTHYDVRGLHVHNYKTDLPVEKGLSSSAAVCVLVTRAFNKIYDLKLTTRGEMEYAYLGEITTPSRCGRMDQGCAYGNRPILMEFDGDRISTSELKVGGDFHFVIVDLKAGKNTKKILNDLNHCYPFAENEVQERVHTYLGKISSEIVFDAQRAIESGDTIKLGSLLDEAQARFDEYLVPASPEQLRAPVLHGLLSNAKIKEYTYGGKGVGSQGDGSAQLLAINIEAQRELIEYIESELHMACLPLDLLSKKAVRKTVIPAAGFGTRLFPATMAVKKELFPVIGGDGRAKPAVLALCEELHRSNIDNIAIIIQKENDEIFRHFFRNPISVQNAHKLSEKDRDYLGEIKQLSRKVDFIYQDKQEGFGHAVNSAKAWVSNEPFVLLLGDHIYRSGNEKTCVQQVMDIYEQYGKSVVGLQEIKGEYVGKHGCVSGDWKVNGKVLSINTFVEKPTLENAREYLVVEGLRKGVYLAMFGIYILNPSVFEQIEYLINNNIRSNGEFQLTTALDRMRVDDEFLGFVVDGRSFDIGDPASYREALIEL